MLDMQEVWKSVLMFSRHNPMYYMLWEQSTREVIRWRDNPLSFAVNKFNLRISDMEVGISNANDFISCFCYNFMTS